MSNVCQLYVKMLQIIDIFQQQKKNVILSQKVVILWNLCLHNKKSGSPIFHQSFLFFKNKNVKINSPICDFTRKQKLLFFWNLGFCAKIHVFSWLRKGVNLLFYNKMFLMQKKSVFWICNYARKKLWFHYKIIILLLL